jgi:hypothetical protein
MSIIKQLLLLQLLATSAGMNQPKYVKSRDGMALKIIKQALVLWIIPENQHNARVAVLLESNKTYRAKLLAAVPSL